MCRRLGNAEKPAETPMNSVFARDSFQVQGLDNGIDGNVSTADLKNGAVGYA